MKRFSWIALLLTLVLGTCSSALAAGNGETTYRALLIGIDGYQTNALSGCVNDTARMAQTLQAANEAGAFYQSPTVLANLQTDEIVSSFSEVHNWGVDDDDVTFFYFAGHGFMSDKGTPAIVGKDSKMLKISELVSLLDQVPGVKLVAFDNRYADSLLPKLSKQDGTLAKALSKYNTAVIDAFKASPKAADYYVLSASTLSSSVEAALQAGEEPRGLITYYLTAGCGYDYVGLRPADELPADTNLNGAVSLGEIRDYIESQILKRPDATDLVFDVQIQPAGSSFPVLARRATAEVLEVKLEEGPVDVPLGRTRQLEAQTQPINASRHTIYWSSSDLSVATVDETGAVQGVKPGAARIAATTSNGLTVSTEVNVRDITPVDELRLNTPRLALAMGSTTKLNLTVLPENASEPIKWASDDTGVVTVDQEGNLNCVGLGETFITVSTDGGLEATCALTVVPKDKVVTKVEVDKTRLEIFEGESRNVRSRVKPADAADPIVQFSSSDPSIADITGESIIVGVARGECTVYATASSGQSVPIKVIVKGASVLLSKDSLLLKPGAGTQLKAQVKPAGTESAITWESSDPAIATVEEGKITAVAEGTCAITASLENGASATCRVMVGGTPAKNVKLKPGKLTLDGGAKQALEVQVKPANASLASLSWKSSDERVAQVDDTGLVTAVGPGRAIIGVKTFGGGKARCLVTVRGDATGEGGESANVSELTVTPSELNLVVGLPGADRAQLTVDAPVSAGAVQVKYASSNPKVASVDQEGNVTARSPGKAIIRAKAGKKAMVDCKIAVAGNRAQYKKPVVGDEEQIYTSARQIFYKDGHLMVQMFFVNRTKAAAAPEAGTIYITLKDGTSVAFKELEAGKKLAPGKAGTLGFKVKVQEGDALYGLDLRGATAKLYPQGEMPEGLAAPETDTPEADAQEADVPADDAEGGDAAAND
ncbi:MAG: Ig-like domain-containing protein [Eubacteriales bacterium]|nr:Ig-like domain-containing protein [Christensenellaceae bacterium]MEA5064564.1 Ig-like domain-containing protein [Eubacteriales bacterium]